VSGHGIMTVPPIRNTGGNVDISKTTGALLSCASGACLWFSQGCMIGCEQCASDGPPAYGLNYLLKQALREAQCDAPAEATLPRAQWTYDSPAGGTKQDLLRLNPWRKPGAAPVVDACGANGAMKPGSTAPNKPPTDPNYPVFANGTSSLPKISPGAPFQPKPWVAGGVAEVAWSIDANHGGGYSYRLCPADGDLSEACFQSNVLEWATNTTTARWPNGAHPDLNFRATDVSEGVIPQGAVWRKNPIPVCNCLAGMDCDPNAKFVVGESENPADWDTDDLGKYPSWKAPYPKVDPRAKERTPRCPTGTYFDPPAPELYGLGTAVCYQHGQDKCDDQFDWMLVDKVKVPKTPGKYVLSFRWDCEQTPQVWNSCADIEIVAPQ